MTYRDDGPLIYGRKDAPSLNLPDAPAPQPAGGHPLLDSINALDVEIAKVTRQGMRGQLENLSAMLRRQALSAVSGEGRIGGR